MTRMDRYLSSLGELTDAQRLAHSLHYLANRADGIDLAPPTAAEEAQRRELRRTLNETEANLEAASVAVDQAIRDIGALGDGVVRENLHQVGERGVDAGDQGELVEEQAPELGVAGDDGVVLRDGDVSVRLHLRRDGVGLASDAVGVNEVHQSSPLVGRDEAVTSSSMPTTLGGTPDTSRSSLPEAVVEGLAGEGVTRTPAGTTTSDSAASPHDGAAGTPAEVRSPARPAGDTTGRAE